MFTFTPSDSKSDSCTSCNSSDKPRAVEMKKDEKESDKKQKETKGQKLKEEQGNSETKKEEKEDKKHTIGVASTKSKEKESNSLYELVRQDINSKMTIGYNLSHGHRLGSGCRCEWAKRD